MGVAPRPSLLRLAVGFAGVGGRSSILVEGPVAPVPASPGGPPLSVVGGVLGPSWGRLLWVLFSAFPGCGLVLAEVGPASRLARWWALWVLPPALSGSPFFPLGRCAVGGLPRPPSALPALAYALVSVGFSDLCVAVLGLTAGVAPAQCALWFMYTCGRWPAQLGWGLGSGASGWAVAPAGSLVRAGVKGGGGWLGCLCGGGVARCSPRPFVARWRPAGLTFFRPVVVCAGGPSSAWGGGDCVQFFRPRNRSTCS